MWALVFFSACRLNPLVDDYNFDEKTLCKEMSEIFVEDAETGLCVFETNDTRYLSENGFTFWYAPYKNVGEKLENICIDLRKESGRQEAGYGIVFGLQEIEGQEFLITVLINTKGMYTIGKVWDGHFEYIQDWKNFHSIKKGYGVENKIEIFFDEENAQFVLKINECNVTMFTVSENIAFKDSRYGYAVVLSHSENFPLNSCKVFYKLLNFKNRSAI